MSKKSVAIIQARIGSSRLGAKVMLDLNGKIALQRVYEQVNSSKHIDEIVISTSTDSSDDIIMDWCIGNKINCFSGSMDDVLDRYYNAAKAYSAENIIRITGDCPLIDPEFIDKTIEFYLIGNYDYVSNSLELTLPDGYDTEIFSFQSLENAWKKARLISEREHVTPYIYKNINLFKVGTFKHTENFSHLRLTLDEINDYIFLYKLFVELDNNFQTPYHLRDVLKVLESKKGLLKINSSIERNEGYKNSLEKDNLI